MVHLVPCIRQIILVNKNFVIYYYRINLGTVAVKKLNIGSSGPELSLAFKNEVLTFLINYSLILLIVFAGNCVEKGAPWECAQFLGCY